MMDDIRPATIDDHLAINLDKVLTAAPTLRAFPDLAVAVAHAGGDVERNAQAVGGLHLMQVMSQAIHQHVNDNMDQYQAAINTVAQGPK